MIVDDSIILHILSSKYAINTNTYTTSDSMIVIIGKSVVDGSVVVHQCNIMYRIDRGVRNILSPLSPLAQLELNDS